MWHLYVYVRIGAIVLCVCAWIALQWNECKRDDDNQNKVVPTDVESKRGIVG